MEEKDIFKTETIYDEMVHREFTQGSALANRGTNWMIVLMEAILLFALLHFHKEGAVYRFLIWSALYVTVIFALPRMRAKKGYQKILAKCGGLPPHNSIHLREDGLYLAIPGGKEEYHLPYSQIRRVVDTPKLILLSGGRTPYIILQKCWLLGGTPAELIAFLKKTCPQVRRIRGIGLGQWLRRILVTTMIVGSLIGLITLSGRPSQPENSKTYAQIAEELSAFSITISDETIAEVESFYAEYPQLTPEFELSNSDKAQELLCMEGMGDYDMDTLEWTPSESGVYWMDAEVFFVDSIYTDFLAGLSAMDAELDFSNVQEDYSKVDIESGIGTLPVSFDFRGQHYELDARYNYDWFDSDMLYEIVRIVNSGGGDKQLYYAFDGGQGFLFYYGTAENVRALKQLTELPFTSRKSLIPQFYF